MKLRPHLEMKAWAELGLTFFFVALAFSGEVKDTFAWVFLVAITSYFGFTSYRNFRASKVVRDEERAHEPPTDATPSERIAYYERFQKASLILAPVSMAILFFTVTYSPPIESKSFKLQLMAYMYTNFGPWVAIVWIPSLLLFIAAAFQWKINRIRSGKE